MSARKYATVQDLADVREEIRALTQAVSALVEANAPAKTVRKPAQKKTTTKAKAAKPAKVTKGAQTRESLSRKDFNRTVTAKARLRGGDAYKRVVASWAQVQECAKAGMTPDETLTLVLG